MLYLIFESGGNTYAMNTGQIHCIIPVVRLQPRHDAPPYVAGVLNLRGEPVVVADMNLLLDRKPCQRRFSTRIIVVGKLAKISRPPNSGSWPKQYQYS